MKIGITILSILFIFLLAGCQRPFEFRPKSEIINEVMLKDPSFSETLDKKTKVDEQIGVLKSEFNNRMKFLNTEIAKLKNELRTAIRDTDSRIKSINAELSPYREELKKNITALIAELKLKESDLSSANKAVDRLNKLSGKDSTAGNPKPGAQQWRDEISALSTRAQELEKDISSLREKIHLNRLKLKLLT